MIFILFAVSFADGDAGRESPFSLGAGARGMGMGRAYVSLAGDASAPFWNPAATAAIDRTNITAFRTTLFLNTNYDYLGISYPFSEQGVFSFFAGRIGTDDILKRDIYNRPSGSFSSSESRLGASYARNIGYGISGGLTLNIVSNRVDNLSGSGAGADLGFQYRPEKLKWLTMGASFIDLIRPGVKLRSVEDKYQTVSRFGVSGNRILNDNISLIVGFDFEKIGGRKTKFHTGAEFEFSKKYFLRFGLDDSRPTFGGGLIYRALQLDYAYENIEYMGNSHRVSFSFSFGRSVVDKRAEQISRIVREEKESWEQSLSDQADSIMSLADNLLAQGRHQEAMGNYQKYLGLNPESERAGIMSDSMMNLIVSRVIADAGNRKREELISDRIGSALNDFKAGKFNDAISKYNLLLEIDPGNKTISELLTSAKYSRSVEITNRMAAALKLQENGDIAGALGEWSRLLALDANDAEAKKKIEELKTIMRANEYIVNALSLIESGNNQLAVETLEKARKLRPNDRSIISLLSEAMAQSVPLTSIKDIKANSSHWSIYLSGLESYQSSDYNKAIEIWTGLEKYYANNPDLRKNINQANGRLSAASGTPEE